MMMMDIWPETPSSALGIKTVNNFWGTKQKWGENGPFGEMSIFEMIGFRNFAGSTWGFPTFEILERLPWPEKKLT